ncbi:dTDP-4-amino-4,6-dideoxy-D-glucose transaminase [Planomonospora parontospora subsp. parontospora]|uniref:dTDP-4-amino-4,6-dideoxy-D-glucose transaminase n=2 Tax=Planomonospora parontospora TaxID=58119 RepID=A0AA37F385_9ACTN|nr:dTDP-4-amino-4,6-dideoxygalactose transaminase [Planomonospora parontospora]GGK55710.1 dTDP-4-amino-4,6-dideoxy-D-glucose transaminase [Planomonospora parontospora]GII07344.1 dTDP-4-amino-4,6-dideoxy-D-glucose transaminase [Planomonospora parontospora subsp. parontospora]
MNENILATIPFNRPHVSQNELGYISEALERGLTSGDGPFTHRASRHLEKLTGGSRALLTTSCTHALEMAAILLGLRPGDEVIMPSFTFVSTANAFVLRGAVPVFADCRPDTLNLDERLVEAEITDRTRAIVAVHYAGVACRMDELGAIAQRHGLALIEDNAHGLGGLHRGRPLGSFGCMATQSFHATKNVQCGEGGALILNDPELVARAEIVREKGTNRNLFFRGQTDKYRWVDIGSSYLPSDVLAAQLTSQLEAFDAIQARRQAVWGAYHRGLADWAGANEVSQPVVPDECAHPAHLYYLLLPDLENRQALIAHLAERGVQATFHYQPLHAAPAGIRYGRPAAGGCPVTERVADRLVRLPLFADMTESDVARVIGAVRTYEVI